LASELTFPFNHVRFILGSALKSKKSSNVSKRFLAILFAWRFVVVPALSIGAVWGVSKLSSDIIVRQAHAPFTLVRSPTADETFRAGQTDPMMAFVLAMAPVGPPALTLCAIADLATISEEIEGQIARIILLSYAVTPFISVSVVSFRMFNARVGQTRWRLTQLSHCSLGRCHHHCKDTQGLSTQPASPYTRRAHCP
jgi:predicted permease